LSHIFGWPPGIEGGKTGCAEAVLDERRRFWQTEGMMKAADPKTGGPRYLRLAWRRLDDAIGFVKKRHGDVKSPLQVGGEHA